MDSVHTIVMGVVEGLTEFIPVSSTGHLILADHWLGVKDSVGAELAQTFEVVIQLGAIAAVIVAFPRRFAGLLDVRRRDGFAGGRGVGLLILTTLPAVVIGLLVHDWIEEHLFSPLTVALAQIVGALWILWAEWRPPQHAKEGLDSLGPKDALAIGLFQCLAMWPGMSRSAATILGGMMYGVERRTATEYSFFAALPVLFAASVWKLYKHHDLLHAGHLPMFALGLGVSFVAALVAVKFLIRFLSQHTLRPFAWYRIALGIAVLIWLR